MVVKCRIQPEYFLDEMDERETASILKIYNETYREEMEERRWLAYVIAQSSTGSYKSPKDLRKFPWDEDIKEEQKIDESELERRKQHLLSIINK